MPRIADVRERQRFLHELTEPEREAFGEASRRRSFSPGEILFREGDDPGGVLAVIAGRMKVSMQGSGGRELVLGFPGEGELIGEMAAISGRPRSATVTAVGEAQGLAMRADQFRQFLAGHARVGSVVLEHVTSLLAEANRQSVDLATQDVTARVAGRLIELTLRAEDGAVALSQDELAAWTGASREAVAKSLHLLRELGWVQTGRRELTVLDAAALRSLVT